MRSLVPRTIGWLLLLLVVLWHFDGTGTLAEGATLRGANNDLPAYVGGSSIAKNVVIFDHEEQNTGMVRSRHNFGKIFLTCSFGTLSFFARPIRWRSRPVVLPALGDNVFDSVRNISIDSQDDITDLKITTLAGGYGRSKSIILVAIAEYRGANHFAWHNGERRRRRREAVFESRDELEAIKHWPDIRTKLPMLRISGNNNLGNSDNHYDSRNYSVESYEKSGSTFATGLMFVACGLLFIFSSVLVPKAVKRDYDPIYLCLAWLGGFISMVVPTLWVIWH